jgi:peptide/nickel transport system permease protein
LLVGDTTPRAEFWAGTDLLGRDIVSRSIVGARTALVGAVVVSVGAFAIATVLGLLSGYQGGATDAVVMRGADLMLALPALLIAIVVVGIVGGGFWVAVLVLILLFAAPDTRIVRSAVLEQRPLPYVEAARTLGVSRPRIMFGHILPNILPIILAYIVLDFAFALVSLAGLSFLGLGIAPGAADWGRMLAENKGLLFSNPWAAVLPALLIVLAAAAMNLVGDWMYDRYSLRQ